jgi:DNA polymerase-3 subunit delta
VKANRAQVTRALDQPDDAVRLILLHGPDSAGSRELAARLGAAMGADAERIDLTGATLGSDPARLIDEAAAIGLFGGARYIWVDGAGDEITAAVQALIEASSAGNPVVAIAGALRPASPLLKLALDSDQILAFASYAPDGADAERLASSIAREAGVRLRPELARRLAAQTGGDRALLRQEVTKFALFLDASPDRPGELDVRDYDLLAVEGEDPGHATLVDAALGGAPLALDEALTHSGPAEPIPLLRALARRLLQLAELRTKVEAGASVETAVASAGRSLFWKDRDIVARQLARLDAATLARAIERTAIAERQVKFGHPNAALIADALLVDIARAAARRH